MRYEYEWITKNEKEPILKVVTRQETSGEEAIISVSYKDNFLNLNAGIQETKFTLKLGPNPTENKATLGGISGAFSYELLNQKGQLVQSKAQQLEHSIDLSELQSGTYLLIIDTSLGRRIQKVVKK